MRRGLKGTGLAEQIVVLVAVSFVAATAQSQATAEDFDDWTAMPTAFSLELEDRVNLLLSDLEDSFQANLGEHGFAVENTATGVAALLDNTTGSGNTANGYWALTFNRTGSSNTATGSRALQDNTSGLFNTATGYLSLLSNTSGLFNTATGAHALQSNTTGMFNTAIGVASLISNTSGGDNTAVGHAALPDNTVGWGNTAIGVAALRYNTTASQNTAVGVSALSGNLTGGRNTAVGAGALEFNTSGVLNTAIGSLALEFNTTGRENTAIGARALIDNQTGTFNTAISPRALQSNTTGEQNVAIGLRAGSFNDTGSRNIFIGSQSGANDKYVDADNQLVIHGNASTSPLIEGDFRERTLRINGDFSATTVSEVSDARLKRDIQPIENALGSILRLGGKTFTWRLDEFPEEGFDEDLDLGLIAQEVEEVLPQLVQEDRDGYKAIEYGKLTAVLVEAMKEQQNQIDVLLERVAELEARQGS